jgi:hypothetical protein
MEKIISLEEWMGMGRGISQGNRDLIKLFIYFNNFLTELILPNDAASENWKNLRMNHGNELEAL